jgi:hypothetical protein
LNAIPGSGESGAGKTETTKHIISQLVELCKAGQTSLEANIRLVNPMLEAFGNAKTSMHSLIEVVRCCLQCQRVHAPVKSFDTKRRIPREMGNISLKQHA